MRVGEVAQRAGVNVETVRYYERRGLLPKPDRTPSGHRRYEEETVRFLGAIKEAQAVGFTLAEIAEYLRAARRSAAPSEALRVRMAAKLDQIDARIAALRRMRDDLARVVGCACSSLDHCTCGAAYLARQGKEPAMRPPLLHVTNGESAGNTLRQTAIGGAVLAWQDALHEGPVPALPRQELLRTRARFLADCGFIGALSCDGSQEVGYFWSAALGWPLVWDQDQETAIRSPHGGPKVTWGGPPVAPKHGKNRLHLDLAPPADGDQQTEVDRLVSLGARRVDIGQGDVDWVVLVDPDGNEFCVLTPR